MPSTSETAPLRNKLRKELRERRRGLSDAYKQFASKRITQLLMRSGRLRRGARVAIYLAIAEELDLAPLIALAWRRGCKLFVPHILNTRRRQMNFFSYQQNSRLITHQWGIRQLVATTAPVTTRMLDVVLAPVVGFDDFGHRLGMGGGFYDRHFAFKTRLRHHKPLLIGVAYACQKISAIEAQPHDVLLDAIVTEDTLTWF